MNRIARSTLVAALFFGALACASGRPPLPAVQFVQPPSDRAYIYLYRNAGLYSGHVKLWLDGVFAGGMGRNSFAFFRVRPGRHVLVAGSKDSQGIALHVLGGEVVYLEQDVTVVPLAAVSPLAAAIVGDDAVLVEFQRVSREEGRAGVRECQLIPDLPPPLPPVAEPEEPSEVPLTGGPRPHARP
jgi:hypothetical protein